MAKIAATAKTMSSEESSTICMCTMLPDLINSYYQSTGSGASAGFKEYTDKDFVYGLVDSGHGLDCDRLHSSYEKFSIDGDPLTILSAGRSASLAMPYVDLAAPIDGRLRTPLMAATTKNGTRRQLLRTVACEAVYMNSHACVKTSDTIGMIMSFHARSMGEANRVTDRSSSTRNRTVIFVRD